MEVPFGADPNLLDKHYVLICDIDLDPCQPGGRVFEEAIIAPDVEVASPGFQGPSFSGALDGQGHSIKNLTIDIWSSPSVGSGRGTIPWHVGLFGEIASGALVNDLQIVDANVCVEAVSGILAGQNHGSINRCSVGGWIQGRTHVGGVAGSNYGQVNECVNVSTLTGSSFSGGIVGSNEGSVMDCMCTCEIIAPGSYVGGVVGDNDGCVTGCVSYVTIVDGGEHIGGLVGLNSGELSYCVCVGTVRGWEVVGGLVGLNHITGDVFRCTSACDVSGESRAGGACGYNLGGALRNCSSTGHIRAATEYSGGFVGINSGTISACYSDGGVAGEDYVGGFSGSGNGSITCCYSMGVVNGYARVGGFVGGLAEASYCYSACVVYAHGATDASGQIGGFAGLDAEITSCFWDTEASRIAGGDRGVGLPTVQMQDIQTYLQAGWDFVGESNNGSEDVWAMPSDDMDYPKLAWEGTCSGRSTGDAPNDAGAR